MRKRIKWSEVEGPITALDQPALVKLVKELFDASADNQAFFASRFTDATKRADVIEPYRQRIVDQFFPKRGFGKLGFREARKAISDYRRVTSDIVGTVELMLVYVENGTRFTNEYGDIEESYYSSLESVLAEAAKLLRSHPEFYPQFQDRLDELVRQTSDMGWGYGDAVSEIVNELEMNMGEA